MIKNGGTVLIALIAELLIRRRRVNVVPEHIQDSSVRDLVRVVDDLNRFSMAGPARGHLLIRRVDLLPAGIARGR